MISPVWPRAACGSPVGGSTVHQNMYFPALSGALKVTFTSPPTGTSVLFVTPTPGLMKVWAKVEQLVTLSVTLSPAFTTMVFGDHAVPGASTFTGVPATAVIRPLSVYGPGAASPITSV